MNLPAGLAGASQGYMPDLPEGGRPKSGMLEFA